MRFVDLFWLVEPAFWQGRFHLSWQDFIAVFALGGVWIAVFARRLKGAPMLPTQDPYAEGELKGEAE